VIIIIILQSIFVDGADELDSIATLKRSLL